MTTPTTPSSPLSPLTGSLSFSQLDPLSLQALRFPRANEHCLTSQPGSTDGWHIKVGDATSVVLTATMHASPEGVGVQLQSMGMCPGYQVSVVMVVPRCRTRCKCNTIVQVSEHGVTALHSLLSAAVL